ncbi:MAG TPA: anthrone oxygenase family protein [Thermomicrobiales bacterium]|nr:anthrone oxygenase family protein [Thermomicrobiales bacterium]
MADGLRVVNLIAAGIAAGILVMVLVAVIPLVRDLPPAIGLLIHQRLDPLIDRVNPPAVVLSAASALLLLLLDRALTPPAATLTALGLAGSLVIAATSLGFNMRINRLIRSWSTDAVPDAYAATRRRWNRGHAVRTAAGMLALCCYATAAVLV